MRRANYELRIIHCSECLPFSNFRYIINSRTLYKLKLVPRFISIMGLTGSTLIFIAALLEMFGIILQLSTWGAVLAIPVALYEMTLAVWLIVKGFNLSAIDSESATTETNDLIATHRI